MSRWRDLLLVFVLFAILVAFTVYGARRSDRDDAAPTGSIHSARSHGALALYSWLQSLGYAAAPLQYTDWQIPDEADALFMLDPQAEPVTAEEAEEVLRWVRDGGTLVLIVTDAPAFGAQNALLRALRAEVIVAEREPELFPMTPPSPTPIPVAQPVLTSPPVTQATVGTETTLMLERTDYVPLISTDHGDVLVGIAEDRGYVYLGASVAPFVNGSIEEPDNPALVLNMLRRVPPGGRVLFDEYHHGFQRAPAAGRRVLDYWWGWAGLYAMIVTGLYLLLTGRRFGRAVPLPQDVARRSSAEYVESLAAIFQRAGKRRYIAEQFHDRLKRRIARPYGFLPPSDDEEFVGDLRRYAMPSDEQLGQVRQALQQLREARTDQQLAQAVRFADALVDERGRLR